jgi:hypothetical protein
MNTQLTLNANDQQSIIGVLRIRSIWPGNVTPRFERIMIEHRSKVRGIVSIGHMLARFLLYAPDLRSDTHGYCKLLP